MWIEDLTKALYFLNATYYKYELLISTIEDNIIYFTNGKMASVKGLTNAYDRMVKTGEIETLNLY